MTDPAPLIVSAVLDDATQAHLDALRRTWFPPDRRVVGAHLTLFHHLPGELVDDVADALADVTDRPAPGAEVGPPFLLGDPPRGVGIPIRAPDLVACRETVAARFRDLLTPQDARRWRPHVTVTNKVDEAAARRTLAAVAQEPVAAPEGATTEPVHVDRLALWRYRGGPWEAVGAFGFGASGSGPLGTPAP